MDIRDAQHAAWANKRARGFNTTDVPLEFCLLQGEVAEAFDAWRKDQPGLGSELADVAIYLFGLAEMVDVDLAGEVEKKLATNVARAYRSLPNGVLVKDDTEGAGH
jgi:NTP pyrophosphatase (non-canonical NTP hydrolase)